MELLTRKQAAQRLKIGLRTLDRRLSTGEMKCYRLGDGPRAPVRISEEQLLDYLKKRSSALSEEIRERAGDILSHRRPPAGA